MIPKVVSLPLRIGLGATRITLTLSAKLALRVAGEVITVVQSHAGSSTQAAPTSPSSRPESSPPSSDAASPAATSSPASAPPESAVAHEEYVAPDDLPDTPLTHDDAVAKTIDDTDELVAEFAETGAEDGAGAQIDLGAPWEGYDSANVEAVTAHIAEADAAQLAVLELYEQAHKQRKTVLDAAERRLRELSPPNAA